MKKSNNNLFIWVLLLITAALISVAAIFLHQSFLRIIPLYVSLFVGILQSRVNRYSFLIGGINCLIYTAVFCYYGLYGTATSTLLVSFPIQIFSFFNWGHHSVDNEVIFKWFTSKKRIIIVGAMIIAQLIVLYFLYISGAKYIFLDSINTVVGIVTTILMFFPYIEYTFCSVFSGICSLILYLLMLKESPEQLTYLIFNLYSIICVLKSAIKANKMYRAQRKIEKENC